MVAILTVLPPYMEVGPFLAILSSMSFPFSPSNTFLTVLSSLYFSFTPLLSSHMNINPINLNQGAGKRPGSEKKKKKKPIAQNPKDLASAYICF